MNREWTAKWIGPQEEDKFNPVIYKDFFVDDEVKKATLFIASLGLFEAYINGTRIGNEFLTPYKQDPEKGVQYFEFDITEELNYGVDSEANSLDVFLGTGWEEDAPERFALKAEIVIEVEQTEEKTEYLSMEFEEVLVKPGTFSEEQKTKEELEDIIEFDDFEMDELLGDIIEDKPKTIESVTEEAEEFLTEEEPADLDNLFNDDLFDGFINEIIEEKKVNAPEEAVEEATGAEDPLEETEEIAEAAMEETATVEEMDFDISAQLISKAGFNEITEEVSEEEPAEEIGDEFEDEFDNLFDDELDDILAEAAGEAELEIEVEPEAEAEPEAAEAEMEAEAEVKPEVEELAEPEAEVEPEVEELEEPEAEVELEAAEEEPEEVEVEAEVEPEVEAEMEAETAEGLAGAVAVAGLTGLAEEVMEEDSEEIEEKEEVEEFFEEEMPDNVIVIATDETWGYYASDIESCGIGKGEVFNRLLWAEKDNPDKDVEVLDLDIPLVERYVEPISVLEELKPEEVIKNAVGEELLDFGKPFTGYVSFTSNLPKGTKVVLDYVDDPDEENEQPVFTYIADGDPEVVGTHFTYFKGRYVKVRGWDGELNPEDFTGYIVLPEEPEEIEEEVPEEVMEPEEEESLQTGFIETSDENLNRLFDNIFARQENLFLDNSEVEEQAEELSEESAEPIDKFTAAACYNMDVKEGIENLLTEQSGKSLVTVPWTLYNMYGDKESLENHYDAMKAYVDETVAGVDGYLKESEEFLPYDENSDAAFIASANYYEAADLVAKAAKTLEKEEDAEKYGKVAEAVRAAILDEYFTASGRNFLSTQEELVTALRTGIYNNKERLVNDLKANFKDAYYQITCGAEETPSLCKTLADNGMEDLAYKLLLEINTYGWLYGVEESDTAIWTSRDAIQEDGTVDAEIQEADDSLEYGAVAEFLYAYVLGIKPLEPGFKKIELAPIPTSNLIYANGEFQSPVGKIVSGWEVLEDGKIQIHFEIPEGTIAKVLLPACEDATIAEQELEAGTYKFEYMPTKDYIHLFNENSTIGDILKYQESLEIIEEINPELAEKIQNADLGVYAEPLDFIENLGIESEQAAEIKETLFRLI